MVYVITILIFIIAFVIDKVRKNSINNQVKNDKNKKEYIIKSVLEDRICKYNNKIVFVISDKKLLHLDWLQNGDLYHSVFKFDLDSAFIKNGFNYNFIEIEKSIDKDNIELIKINNVKSLLIELYDVIIPDINELHASINTTKKNINIAESLVNKTQYIELMKKYLLTQETILQKALDMQNRYNSFIKEIYAQYEIEKFESDMSVSILDRNIEYKYLKNKIDSQLQEYISYRKIYENLSIELKD